MTKNQDLFSDFSAVNRQEWMEKVKQDLKGADFDKKLVWHTLEGFDVLPFYRKDDVDNIETLNTDPGQFPFRRGVSENNDWFVRQDIDVTDPLEANKKALNILNKGVTAIGFNISGELSYEQFEILLKDIVIEAVPVYFNSNDRTGLYTKYLSDYVQKNNLDKEKIFGAEDFDSLGFLSLNGFFPCGKNKCSCASDLLSELKDKLPNYRALSVNAKNFQNAGSNIVQEVAFGLSMAVEYLDNLTENDLNIDQLLNKIQFNFASGSNYFMEIAKLRAARMLWAKIADSYNPENKELCKMHIHVETATWNMTVYDPYVNMIRATTETMSAAIAGAESINVLPTNIAYEKPTDFSERIARNIQLILKEEAHFDKVTDPSGGSYYIENLTDKIADAAWNLFLEVEEKGGYSEAFKQNFIQDEIKETIEKRNKKLEKGRETLLGTNKYPNEDEELESGVDINRLFTTEMQDSGNGRPLRLFRIGEEFEAMRLKTDNSMEKPSVFMLTIGQPAMRSARAQFAANFFAVAGFEIINNIGFDSVEEGYKKAKEDKANIIVLCSSDEEYEKYSSELAELDQNNKIIVIAGNPESKDKIIENTGIKDFINVRSNILETLKDFQNRLGI